MNGRLELETLTALTNEITTLCGHLHAAEYRLLELVRRLDEMAPWGYFGVISCAHWLNWKCGIALSAAREKVRVAHALAELPLIRAAFREGRLSYSKVRAITRIATPETEADYVEIAMSATAAHVEKIVRKMRQVESLEARAAAFDGYRHRELMLHPIDQGTWWLRGELTPEQGAVLRQALDRAMDWVYRGQPMGMRGSEPQDDVASIPRSARLADALVALAERFLGQPPGEDETLNTADRFQVTVHVSAETLPRDGSIDPDDPPETEDGAVLAAESARRLCCDAAVVPMLETRDGEPLAVGRKTRTISAALRRALKRRDGGCRFPGCVNTRFVDGHHIVHWADGGETSLDNLVLLCRHHHTLLHEGGYGVVREGREFVFWRTDGSIVPRVNDVQLRGDVAELMTRQREIGIDATTTVPNWDGGRPDYGYITEVLCYRRQYFEAQRAT